MKERLQTEMKEALKAKDKERLQTIRMLLSAIQYEEMNSGDTELSPETITSILKSELKKRKEALEFAERDDRVETIASTQAEIKVIESFLPTQLSAEELEGIVTKFIADTPGANMGQIMKALKENHNGQYDGKLASQIVKKLTS